VLTIPHSFFLKLEIVLFLRGNTSLVYEQQFIQKRKQGSISKKKSTKSFFFFLNFLNLILPSVRREAAVQITRGFTHPYSSYAKREVILSPRIKQDT